MSKGGRPSRYKPDFAEQAAKLCKLGATDKDLSEFFGVTDRTINRWKEAHPEFCHALKLGKESADDLVQKSLYQRAIGYSHPETKVFNNQGEIVTHEVTKHYPPDTVSMIFWLKNRRPEMWRDKQEHEHTHTGRVEHTEVPQDDKQLIRELRKARANGGRVTH